MGSGGRSPVLSRDRGPPPSQGKERAQALSTRGLVTMETS